MKVSEKSEKKQETKPERIGARESKHAGKPGARRPGWARLCSPPPPSSARARLGLGSGVAWVFGDRTHFFPARTLVLGSENLDDLFGGPLWTRYNYVFEGAG